MHRVTDLVFAPRFSGPLDGAAGVGEATGGERLLVRIGVWLGPSGAVRARWRATTCPAVIAYCEAACEALEAGLPADEAALRGRVAGVHPQQEDRAAIVAAAARSARERAERSHPP